MNKVLVTGSAGFIVFRLCKKLIERGDKVVGIDIINREGISKIFAEEKFDIVVNLAAQAGVKYSLINLMHT